MTTRQTAGLRKFLESNIIELNRNVTRRDTIAVEQAADEIDRRLGAVDREMAVRTLEFESAKLRQTRAALHRLGEGTYGICQQCEEEISPKRMAAIPTASLCLACQEAEDLLHPHGWPSAMAA